MPLPPRVQFAGAVYHLMNRGVRGEDLYTDAREHATTPEPTLSVRMQWLNSCYAQWFNWRHLIWVTPSSAASTLFSSRAIRSSPKSPVSWDWLLTEFGVGIEQARVNLAAFIRAAE